MTDVVERLRASKAKQNAERQEARAAAERERAERWNRGREQGREWAKERADYGSLTTVATSPRATQVAIVEHLYAPADVDGFIAGAVEVYESVKQSI